MVLYCSEIYAKQIGQVPLKDLILPQCQCPREMIDSFNLLSFNEDSLSPESVNNSLCRGVNPSVSTSRYDHEFYGKFSLFSTVGWISDLTNSTSIIVSFPQPMLVRNPGLVLCEHTLTKAFFCYIC